MGKRLLFLFVLLLLPWQAQAGLRKLKQNTDTTVNIHLVNASTGAGITGATVTSITAFVAKHKDTGTTTKTDLTITAAGGGTTDAREVGLGAYNLEIPASLADTLGELTLCYSYTAAVTTCDSYEVSAASDPQFLGDYASLDDFLAVACADATVAGSWGKQLCDNIVNLDSTISGIPAALMGTTYEGAHTFKHFLQYGSLALFGKYDSASGTFNFRDLGDTKNRIVYTTTATSRATVTLSPD